MAFFVRFTTNAKLDLERGKSFHCTPFSEGEISIEKLAASIDCDEDDIEVVDGLYVQMLEGLCGFKLDAKTLNEAIEETKEGVEDKRSSFQQYSPQTGSIAIFKGIETDADVPDGDNFIPLSIEKIL